MEGTLIITSRTAVASPQLLELVQHLPNRAHDAAILFVGDGVYSLVDGSANCSTLKRLIPSVSLFGCKDDIESRGIEGKLTPESSVVDYDQMVELIMERYSRVVSYL